MKRLRLLYISLLTGGMLTMTACTDGFEELNTDPNSFNAGPPTNVFAGVVKNTLDLVGGIMNDRMYLNYASYIGGKGGAQPRFGLDPGIDGYWSDFYVDILKNTQEIIDNYGDNPDFSNRVQVASIWKAYVASVMVTTYGVMPFQEALGETTTPAYDSEAAVVEDILTMLENAAASIDPDGDSFSAEPIFNGNNAMWIKFANSLRLKFALRVSEGFPSLAESHGRAAMSNEAGLIASNDESVFMRWETLQENWSFNYSNYVFGDPLPDVIPYVNHHFILNMKTYRDPRTPRMFDPGEDLIIEEEMFAEGSTTETVLVRYEAPYFGRPLGSTNALDAWDLNPGDNILQGFPTSGYTQPSAEFFFQQDMSFNIITYAEMNFIKAEAALKGWGGGMSADQYYYEGIQASFDQYGASGYDEYIAQDGIAWGTASTGDFDLFGAQTSGISADDMDKIVRQRWIAMYWQGHDGWCLEKRTRMTPVIPHFNPVENANEFGYSLVPERMIISTTEAGTNPTGYESVPTLLGGPDELTTALAINKASNGIAWEELPAFFNQQFAEGWYGDSVDDLIAAGVEYEIVE